MYVFIGIISFTFFDLSCFCFTPVKQRYDSQFSLQDRLFYRLVQKFILIYNRFTFLKLSLKIYSPLLFRYSHTLSCRTYTCGIRSTINYLKSYMSFTLFYFDLLFSYTGPVSLESVRLSKIRSCIVSVRLSKIRSCIVS